MRGVIVFISIMLVGTLGYGQSKPKINKNGVKVVTTYWDGKKTKKQSQGKVVDNPYYSFNGKKMGKWTYWFEDGRFKKEK